MARLARSEDHQVGSSVQPSVTIIDYGAGNLRSVAKALESLGHAPLVTNKASDVGHAYRLILPGVGAAADTMTSLERLGLVEPVVRYIESGRPFFGVCLGLQVLLDGSEEGGWQPCLGIIPGRVKRFPPGRKVPHMGWNQVGQTVDHPLFAGIPDQTNFYFVHSYYADPADGATVAGRTEYVLVFSSVLIRDNVVATQFHPEKSSDFGLRLYANFMAWQP
jgi:glutamine amidotransferase